MYFNLKIKELKPGLVITWLQPQVALYVQITMVAFWGLNVYF